MKLSVLCTWISGFNLLRGTTLQAGNRGFDSRWSHWPNLPGSTMGPVVGSASNKNAYQVSLLWGKGGRCVGLTLPPSCAVCLEILGAPNYRNPKGPYNPVQGLFYLYKHNPSLCARTTSVQRTCLPISAPFLPSTAQALHQPSVTTCCIPFTYCWPCIM